MKEVCGQIRRDVLRIAKLSGHGHIPSCFSVVEILVSLYSTMKHKAKEPNWKDRDLFVLSKGHASLALYCTLARFGYFPLKDVETFGAFGSAFGCHPDRNKVPGVEASTGSLGHGIGIAVGMALALKIKKQYHRKVYCLIGDGEANEGSVWESAMVAANNGLDNLVVLYDDNASHGRGLQIKNPDAMFMACGFSAARVNGHDVDALSYFIGNVNPGKPNVILAETRKGCGSGTMESDSNAWHRRTPTDEEYDKIMAELK